MKFKRINEDTIRCIITEEDMIEHGVNVDDFLRNRGNAREFLHEIVERASEEIGYEVHSGMLSMQVMPLPSNALAVTFSEQNENSLNNIIEGIRHAIGSLEAASTQEKMDELKDASDEERAMALEQFMQEMFGGLMEEEDDVEVSDIQESVSETSGKTVSGSTGAGTHDKEKNREFFLIEFDSLTMAEAYCKAVPCKRPIRSMLYKTETESYLLLIYRGRMNEELFTEISLLAADFGYYIGQNKVQKSVMLEHMQPIISKSAVKVLREL